jgi:hypothetical protein
LKKEKNPAMKTNNSSRPGENDMKTNQLSNGFTIPISIGLAILAALLVFLVLAGRKIPFIQGDRAALVTLFVIGFAMCGLGISRISASGQWAHPLTIIGCLLGALAILCAAAGYFGFRFFFVHDPRGALIAVGVLMAAKLVLSIVHSLIQRA